MDEFIYYIRVALTCGSPNPLTSTSSTRSRTGTATTPRTSLTRSTVIGRTSNTRLPVLADYGLLKRVGPAPKSGLYAITDKGKTVVTHRESYRTDGVDFDALVAKELDASGARPASATDD